MNLNKAFILGRCCSDIADKEIPSTQTRVAEFSIATNSTYGKGDKKTENVQYHNIIAYGRLAEIIIEYLQKGQLIFVEGRIQTRKWKNGNNEDRIKTEIIAENIQLGPKALGSMAGKPGSSGSGDEYIPIIEAGDEVSGKKPAAKKESPIEIDEIDVKDIPF